MCFTVSIFAATHEIETDLGATFNNASAYQPYFHVSGFVHPDLPFVTNSRPGAIESFRWGLIPGWTKDREQASALSKMTLNAKSETIFEKPSFRSAIQKRRGLLPVLGFVEWRHEGESKIPHLVRAIGGSLFTLGCVWESWTDTGSGEILNTFSIITTEANQLMQHVHNNKQRMPVVIRKEQRTEWLETTDRGLLIDLMRPLEQGMLEAYPVSREVSRVKVNTEHGELLDATGDVIL